MLRRTVAIVAITLWAFPAWAERGQRTIAQSGADALLAIDRHRASVIDRIVRDWGDSLTQSTAGLNAEQLRTMLTGLRADHLLAASLAGTLDGLRNILAAAVPYTLPSRGALMPTKALGDSGDDVVYTPVTPCRLVETRPGTFAAVFQGDGAFSPNEIRNYTIQGGNGVCLTQLPGGLSPNAVQLQVFGIPINSGSSGDIEILPQGSTFGSTATEVYVGNVLINTVSTTANINLANNQIGVQVRGGGANVAIDVVGYFKRPGSYGGTHAITGQYATDSGGANNAATGDDSTVGGGDFNTASLRASAVGGGEGNVAGDAFSTVSGGNVNKATGESSAVGGGYDNTAGGFGASIAGGGFNTAVGDFSGVASGYNNHTQGRYAVVAGGQNNHADADYNAVVGGVNNQAYGAYSVILGGAGNITTSGAGASFVAGTLVHATHIGQFVWADNQQFVFDPGGTNGFSDPTNTFSARATGGVWFVTGVDGSGTPTHGCSIGPGGGSWGCTSSRDEKTDFESIDVRQLLRKVLDMPVQSWRFKTESDRIRHVGPMAQDFYATFGLGHDPRAIEMVDANGVAFAAVQGLHQLVKEKDARLAELERRLLRLERFVDAMCSDHANNPCTNHSPSSVP